MRLRTKITLLAAVAACLTVLAGVLAGEQSAQASSNEPNVIFILTDDQTTSELAAMPNVLAGSAAQGATFKRAYVPYPLCCPSRASLLSGEYMHNHGVRGNVEPAGGWGAFRAHESNALPVWTHDAGYYNVQIGKYMNGYASAAGSAAGPGRLGRVVRKGLRGDSLTVFFNYLARSRRRRVPARRDPRRSLAPDQDDEYQTDVFGAKAVDFDRRLGPGGHAVHDEPLVQRAPLAVRSRRRATSSLADGRPAEAPGLQREGHLRQAAVAAQAGQAPGQGAAEDDRRGAPPAIEQLLSVDEAVGARSRSCSAEGILDDTYIIFASDNGYFRGEHRIAGGKFLRYEPSARCR